MSSFENGMVFERPGVAVHEGPHGAVVQFLRPYLGNSRSRSALLASPELELPKLLGRGPTGLIGLSLELGASICGDHYWEDMEGLDIPEFEQRTWRRATRIWRATATCSTRVRKCSDGWERAS